ncbi:MAG: DarT ssDNA thymidine ADP-ribosyltransferase family protein [Amnibacterium sp.]
MCDICFPRTVPAPPPTVAASATTGTRARPERAPRATPSRTTTATRRVAGAAAPSGPPFGSRRLYHWTHSRNLEAILLDGALKSIADGADPDVDVAAPLVRELRAAADVGDGTPVDRFVPFSLSPDADRWAELRDGADGAAWSTAARLSSSTEYVMLVLPATAAGDDAVVAYGDASAPATTFAIGEPARAVARATRDDPELATVEVLLPGPVPLSAVTLIGVPNEPMRARVRRMFDAVDATAPRIVVHPPWFTPAAG